MRYYHVFLVCPERLCYLQKNALGNPWDLLNRFSFLFREGVGIIFIQSVYFILQVSVGMQNGFL